MFHLTHEQMRFMQVLLVALAGFSGFTSGLLLGKIGSHFNKNCFLYANISIRSAGHRERAPSTTSSSLEERVFVNSDTTWGRQELCDMVTYEGVLVFIVTFVWLWFFINMESDRDGISEAPLPYKYERRFWLIDTQTFASLEHRPTVPSDHLFIVPPIVLHTILCFISMLRVSYATEGYQHFCLGLCKSHIGQICQEALDGCRILQYRPWVYMSSQREEPGKAFAFHDAMKTALVLAWLEPLMLGTHVLMVLLQVYLQTSATETTNARKSTPNSRVSRNKKRVFDSSRSQSQSCISAISCQSLRTSIAYDAQNPFIIPREHRNGDSDTAMKKNGALSPINLDCVPAVDSKKKLDISHSYPLPPSHVIPSSFASSFSTVHEDKNAGSPTDSVKFKQAATASAAILPKRNPSIHFDDPLASPPVSTHPETNQCVAKNTDNASSTDLRSRSDSSPGPYIKPNGFSGSSDSAARKRRKHGRSKKH